MSRRTIQVVLGTGPEGEALHRQLREAAESEGVSLSEWARARLVDAASYRDGRTSRWDSFKARVRAIVESQPAHTVGLLAAGNAVALACCAVSLDLGRALTPQEAGIVVAEAQRERDERDPKQGS